MDTNVCIKIDNNIIMVIIFSRIMVLSKACQKFKKKFIINEEEIEKQKRIDDLDEIIKKIEKKYGKAENIYLRSKL